ncbi:MAG: hypothetical protein BWK76_22830 [Desulfobulbaceae bacterium A2]|nr:MAG: hypothetical protein BWK76_22830 [Desulfobulbaceae bacterium A2]
MPSHTAPPTDPPLRGCVRPPGIFVYGVHQPGYQVANLRREDHLLRLGAMDGADIDNRNNFPADDLDVAAGRPIYEIGNPLPFRGSTFIDSGWAAARAQRPEDIRLPAPPPCSLHAGLDALALTPEQRRAVIATLPRPLRYALAACSDDTADLVTLARHCGRFVDDAAGRPVGLVYETAGDGRPRPVIDDVELFETIANNPRLPDDYKEAMVLRPGVQGGSEIVGDWREGGGHVFEYLRRNSYIAGGHFAANMAHDAIRYATGDLSAADMRGLRHLYYQRTYVSLAERLGITVPVRRRPLSENELEDLRRTILSAPDLARLEAPATLWGWNFGYDISASGYRLHASHQQIHQQFALVPGEVRGYRHAGETAEALPAYSCGDLVADCVRGYRRHFGRDFFSDYLQAIANNQRLDNNAGPASLVVWQDERVLLFVPKAQVSQWELQIMAVAEVDGEPVANIVQADSAMRASLDQALRIAQQILARLGARMVSSIEYSGRIGTDATGQRLLYSLLPKLPWAMGAFSEAQLRWICGHFPEDFAQACRMQLPGVTDIVVPGLAGNDAAG